MMHSDSRDVLGVYNLGVLPVYRLKGIGRLLLLMAYNSILLPNTLKKIVGVTLELSFLNNLKHKNVEGCCVSWLLRGRNWLV